MSGKRPEQTITITFDDLLLIEVKHWHGDGETFRIFETTGEILVDALYEYLDGKNGHNVHTLPPWRKSP